VEFWGIFDGLVFLIKYEVTSNLVSSGGINYDLSIDVISAVIYKR
jgi:hypothetical protein